MSKQIFLDAPNIGKQEKKYLNRAIDSGYVSTIGPFVEQLEKKFANYIGSDRAVSVQSGTAALHMALYELGIGRGDEVIVPALTFIATVNPVIYVGAKPIFVDVDIKTWNIDPHEIEKRITKKTKAIIPVHLYGNSCDMDKIMDIARKHRLYVIEDATESLGTMYGNRYTGTFGHIGCFSFNGNKLITTGGGGMVVSKNVKRSEHVKFLVNQARDDKEGYSYSEVGFNYRMTNIEASLGLAQMERLERFLQKKRKCKVIYEKELGNLKPAISFQQEYGNTKTAWWLFCVIFSKRIDIVSLQKELMERGIQTRRIFKPVTESVPYRKYRRRPYRNSLRIYKQGLCLPSSTLNSDDDIYEVCRMIKKLI